MSILIFFISLGILILVHELGHFWVARKSGVIVEEFGLGFPPRIFSRKKGDTLYSINLIPLGGFVKLAGEEDPENPKGFLAQPPLKKIAITLAGVVANFILIYFLFSLGYLIGLPDFDSKLSNVTVLQVMSNSPAEKADLRLGDKLLALRSGDDLIQLQNPTELRKIAEKYAGKKAQILIQRGEEKLWKEILLEKTDSPQKGPLGVVISSIVAVKKPFPVNFIEGGKRTFSFSKKILVAFKDLFKQLITERKVTTEVAGPLGIFNIYQQMRLLGWGYLFHFWAIISFNLVIINLLPLPALDGGRIIFNIIELIRGKPISLKFETMIHQIGFVLLLLLLVIISIKDLRVILTK
ncbi:MAG: M50 family metallopeptidase [Patescibacteria group bacterium]